MKLDWGQEGWTGPIVCWGEGGIGVKKVWVTGRKLTIVNGGEGRPKPSTGHLGWIKSGSLRGLGDCRGERSRFPVRTFFVKVRLDGFSRTHDAGYFDPVPTRYPSAAQNLFIGICMLAIMTVLPKHLISKPHSYWHDVRCKKTFGTLLRLKRWCHLWDIMYQSQFSADFYDVTCWKEISYRWI